MKNSQGTWIVYRLPIKFVISINFYKILEKLDQKNPPKKLPKNHTKSRIESFQCLPILSDECAVLKSRGGVSVGKCNSYLSQL